MKGPVTEASMRAAPEPMQSKRLYAEQLVDAIVEVAIYKIKLEEVRRQPAMTITADREIQAMQRYSHAREIAVMLVIAEEAGRIL